MLTHGNMLKRVIIISLVFELAVAQTDPCTTYKPFPDSERRGTNYTLSNAESGIDDYELTKGWYGDTRYTLVDKSPGFYRCGGWYPMYIQAPTNSSSLTICVQSLSLPCEHPFEIERRTCNGYEVYKLLQAPVHRAVYCLTASDGAPPEFDEKPTVTFELLHKRGSSELLSFCNFTRSSENLFYKTIWYVEGSPIYTFDPLEWSSDNFDYIGNRTLTEQLLQGNGVAKAGFHLQCGVQALYGPGKPTSSGELSEARFLGVKISQHRSLLLKEGDRRTIHLEMTVPYGCGTRIKDMGLPCKFDINVVRVENPGNKTLASVIESSCSVKPITSTTRRTSVTVVGKITPSYGEETATTHLKLKTPSKSILFSSFWADYEIGLVTIQLVKNTTMFESKRCSSANDPHIATFDYTTFYLAHADVYTLYTDLNNIEVQIQTEDCGTGVWDGPFCTCGVAVRAGRTVFEISHCESLTWHIGFTACGDDGNVLQVRRRSTHEYRIHLPTGTTVGVYIQPFRVKPFLNVDVMSSVNDFGKSRGMCGKLSTTSDDDLVMRNGSLTTSVDIFAESWRVSKTKNLFDPKVIGAGLSLYKPLLHYCSCTEGELTCTAKTSADIEDIQGIYQTVNPKNCAISKRKKRMALRVQKRSKRQAQPSPQGWFNGWNETLAQAYCEDKFSDSKAVESCQGVPGVNIAKSKHDCVNDIKLSGSVDFVSMAVESVYVACFSEALVNPVLQKSKPGNSSVLAIITEKTCTHDCNKRGVCEEGQCRCNPGFGGGDCSIELSKPPTLFDFGEGSHCDLARDECSEIAVLGDIFSGEEYSRCQIKKTTVQQDGRMDSSSVTTSKAVTESISEVYCYLPDASADDVTTSYTISVANTGTFYSNELTVLVYDSTCVSVNHDTMIWNLRDEYCTYKGKCVPEGGTLPDDPSLSCEIIGNKRIWKSAKDGKGTKSAANVNGHGVFGFMGLLVAAATALGYSR